MTLPPAVQAQLDAAEATLEKMQRPRQQTPLEDIAKPPPAKEPEPPPEIKSSTQPAAEPPAHAPAPQVQPQPPAEDSAWVQRYRTLQGICETQGRQVADLKAQLQQAVEQLNRAAQDKQEAVKSGKHAAAADPADVEAFGQDLVEMVQRVAQRHLASLHQQASEVVARIDQLEERLKGASQVAMTSAEDRFFDRLAQLVPQWEQINQDPGFIAWLGQVDPIYGRARQEALNEARQALDANRAAAVFKTWTDSQAPAVKPAAVEKQVSPKASAASAPPAPQQKPRLTQSQIVEFYDQVRRGGYRGREDEARRIELVINEAIAEGRVT